MVQQKQCLLSVAWGGGEASIQDSIVPVGDKYAGFGRLTGVLNIEFEVDSILREDPGRGSCC